VVNVNQAHRSNTEQQQEQLRARRVASDRAALEFDQVNLFVSSAAIGGGGNGFGGGLGE
jgi:hypothetical protein